MIYTVIITFDGTQWQGSIEGGEFRIGGSSIEDVLIRLQAILPANADGSPAVIALG